MRTWSYSIHPFTDDQKLTLYRKDSLLGRCLDRFLLSNGGQQREGSMDQGPRRGETTSVEQIQWQHGAREMVLDPNNRALTVGTSYGSRKHCQE